jgi:hypothetical protein
MGLNKLSVASGQRSAVENEERLPLRHANARHLA